VGAALLCTVALLALLALFVRIAHRPPSVHEVVSTAEIDAEDIRLRKMGLNLHGESFLKPYPFEPPWTSHSLLIPSTWTEPGFKRLFSSRRVRADLLLADLDVLEPVMARVYGGWDSASARGWDWNAWFAGWRERLSASGTAEISLDEAFAPMDQLLSFQRDNHTQIPLSRFTSDGSQTALLTQTPSAACTESRAGNHRFPLDANDAGQHVHAARLWTRGATFLAATNYIAAPSSKGTLQAVRCGADWISLQPITERRVGLTGLLHRVWAVQIGHEAPAVDRVGNGIIYVRLPSFDSAHYTGLSHEHWATREPGDKVLIVDLRHNEGGSAEYGLDVLKDWIDERRMIQFDSIGSQMTSCCLYAALKWNFPGATSKRRLQQLLDRMAQPYPPGCPRTVETTPAKWTYLQHQFNPKRGDMRILAVVDSKCASDCEWMTEALASLPETLVAGVNTYGVSQMIQPGYSVLPHTGLRYRIALRRSNPYGDNRSVEGYGLGVDLLIPDVDQLGREQLIELANLIAKL